MNHPLLMLNFVWAFICHNHDFVWQIQGRFQYLDKTLTTERQMRCCSYQKKVLSGDLLTTKHSITQWPFIEGETLKTNICSTINISSHIKWVHPAFGSSNTNCSSRQNNFKKWFTVSSNHILSASATDVKRPELIML